MTTTPDNRITSNESPVPKEEPICRVGIVLESDNKTSMDIVLPIGKFKIWSESAETVMECKEEHPLKIELSGDKVLCKDKTGKILIETNTFISIQNAEEKETLGPKSGILLKNCVTGRGFHWQKEVDFYYPYKLEFYNWNSKLVVVNEVPMEAYITCVVTSEMGAECPPEFIKAQATAARSWSLVNLKDKHRGVPFKICNDDCCQRYQGTTYLSQKVADSVEGSKGMYLVAENGDVCSAFYSKCCGGIIEKGSNIFGSSGIPLSESIDAPQDSQTKNFNPLTEKNIREWIIGDWLKDSDSFCSPNICPEDELHKYLGAVDEKGSYYRWKVTYTQDELVNLLKNKAKINDIVEFIDFQPGERGNSGRLHQLGILYKTKDGHEKSFRINSQYKIRNALHEKFLFSSAFIWDYEKDASGKMTKIILQGAGWGHGAGLCQMGALGMALKGYSYEDILKLYYDKTELVKAY